jgi:hypothetical protein
MSRAVVNPFAVLMSGPSGFTVRAIPSGFAPFRPGETPLSRKIRSRIEEHGSLPK